jgi:glycosyl transferase family 25
LSFPLYVINLEASRQRYDDLCAHLRGLDLGFERVAGVDGRRIDVSTYPYYDDVSMRAVMGRSLSSGELGCALSHRKAIQQFVKSGEPWAVILEDDARLGPNSRALVIQMVAWLTDRHPGWRLVNLGHPVIKHYSPLTELRTGNMTHLLVAAHYYPMGAFALLWSRRGALDFLERSETVCLPFDSELQQWLCRAGEGYASSPPIASVSSAESDIDQVDNRGDRAPSRHDRDRFFRLKKYRRLWANHAAAILRQWRFERRR